MWRVRILVVLCFSLGTFEAGNQRQYPSWQELFTSPLLADVVTRFGHEDFLDVLVPTGCFGKNQETVRRFLQNLRIPVRFFTDIEASSVGGIDGTLMYRMYNLVALLCEHTPWRVHIVDGSLERALFHHFMKLYVISESYMSQVSERRLKLPSNILRHPGTSVTVISDKVVLTNGYQARCLNCAEDNYLAKPPEFGKALKVNQSLLFGWCTLPYTCSRYTFTTLVDTLRHRNATVKVIETRDHSLDTDHALIALSHGNVFVELSQQFNFWSDFANARMPEFYDAMGYWFLAMGPQPIPKEQVLILPFTGSVWAALLLSVALHTLLSAVVARALRMTSVKRAQLIFPFFSTLLQQSEPPSPQLSKSHSFRLLLGTWSIVVLVMATAFKGCLVSLLRDIPLRGNVPEYWSVSTLTRQGYRICMITNHLGVFYMRYLPRTLRKGEKHLQCQVNGTFNILGDGKDGFLIRSFPFGEYEAKRRQLYNLGFVEAPSEALSEFAGPLMQASSPYLKDVGKTIKDGVMYGLYARASALEAFKAYYRRSEGAVSHEAERTLTLYDLRPYFLVWAAGIGLSLAVFLVEAGHLWCSSLR